MTHPLNASVRSVGNGHVTLELDDGQQLQVPEQTCDRTCQPGEGLRLFLASDEGGPMIARHIINELLGSAGDHESHAQG